MIGVIVKEVAVKAKLLGACVPAASPKRLRVRAHTWSRI